MTTKFFVIPLLVYALLLLGCPAIAQDASNASGPVITTAWTVEAHVNNIVPDNGRVEASTPAAARTAAQSLCGAFGGDQAASCLALLKSRSLTSLTASGYDQAVMFLVLEKNLAGGFKSYIVITAQRKD